MHALFANDHYSSSLLCTLLLYEKLLLRPLPILAVPPRVACTVVAVTPGVAPSVPVSGGTRARRPTASLNVWWALSVPRIEPVSSRSVWTLVRVCAGWKPCVRSLIMCHCVRVEPVIPATPLCAVKFNVRQFLYFYLARKKYENNWEDHSRTYFMSLSDFQKKQIYLFLCP